MNSMEHEFTRRIKEILRDDFGAMAKPLYHESELLQYLNIKTKSANRGAKSRGSFANLYAIYVLVEDYLARGFHEVEGYSSAEGAIYSALLQRQRELPFGQKLQNHALNHRMNEEFKKYFPSCEHIPIVRTANRYWFNEQLLIISANDKKYNIAATVIQIIKAYMDAKRDAFEQFIEFCENVQKLAEDKVVGFVTSLLEPTVDARIFEIVSYSVLKYYYHNQTIYWGFELDTLIQERLTLYKTGRTNANDGGIDFVMKPLGRFFQVTETVDVKKYFLDIDKIQKFPITFVVKSSDSIESISDKIRGQAEQQYSVKVVVAKYMECIEEIINVPMILDYFRVAISNGFLGNILEEIIKQSKVEFNYEDDSDIANEIIEDITEDEARSF